MRHTTRRVYPILLIAALIHFGCSEDVIAPTSEPGNQSNERITITNDEAVLAGRVHLLDEDVPIDTTGAGGLAKRGLAQAFKLKLVAEVLPPAVDGQILQATSIAMKGDKAIVSYNMRGEQYLGGIDVFDIENKRNPKLKSEALFRNADINAVSFDVGYVHAAEATDDTSFEYPAVLEIIKLEGSKLVLDGNRRVGLTSYAGTSVSVSGSTIYATSGDNGGVSAFDGSSLIMTTWVSLHDARWVDVKEGKVVVVQGTPGLLSVFSEGSLSVLGTFSFMGADIPESKSTVEVVEGKAFIAAGSAGVQVLSVNTGTVVGTVPRPDPSRLGLDPSVVVTNAVTVDEDLLFISNGEAGVYVAQGRSEFDETGSEEPQEITLLGKLQFNNLQSVNHVYYRGRFLIVASGLGGLKVVKVEL